MIPKRFEDTVWYMKDGTPIEPMDMTATHLLNTMNFLRKADTIFNLKEGAEVEFLSLPYPEGGAAQDAYERELQMLTKRLEAISDEEYFEQYIKPSPLYRALVNAFERKGAGR